MQRPWCNVLCRFTRHAIYGCHRDSEMEQLLVFLVEISKPSVSHVEAKRRGLRIPFDLRILRILLPVQPRISKLYNSAGQAVGAIVLTSDDFDLGNTMAVSKHNTNLRRSRTLFGELADVVDNRLWGALEPRRH